MEPEISIVIVNYNVKHFLEQCLMAIEKAKHNLNIEIFVVDNASVDGSQAMIKKKFPNVLLIENSKNLGFARANNQALKIARGRYVLIINPDTLIQEDTLLTLKNILDENPGISAIGCKLINPDGSFQIASRRSIPTPWVAFTKIVGLSRIFPKSKIFGKYNMTYISPDVECEVDVLSGSLMMVRAEMLKKVGYFDEDYFMYGEDIDLCYRIKKAGGKIYYTPRTKAIHYKGESTRKGEFSYITNFYSSMLIFIDKHFKDHYSILVKIILKLGIYLRAYIAYLISFFKTITSPLLDFLLIILSIFLAIKFWLPHYPLFRFRIIFPVYTFIWLLSIYLAGAYHTRGKYHLKPLFAGALVGFLLNSTFTYFFKQFAYSRVVILIAFVMIIFILSAWRLFYRWIGPHPIKHPLSRLRRTIIVGAGKEGIRILKKLRARPDIPYEICGFVDFDERNVGKEIDGTEVLSTIENIREVIKIQKIDDVIFSSDRLSNKQILETISYAGGTGVNFRIVPHELEYIIAKSSVDEIDSVPLLDFISSYDPVDMAVKRVFDIFMSLFIIILSSPIFLINFILGGRLKRKEIYKEKGGTATIYIFEGGSPAFKNLPLFFSVLTGTLSIVGAEIIEAGKEKERPFFKPGVTGIVQLKLREKNKRLTPQEKDYYNLYYLKNRTVLTDLQILFKSIF
ncbi:MAG: glycosyltransferase [candidate division WOR-3 bacterium]|nr:glycosyltransferase [candidate division WOR-3 bacterium]